ncbi:MAG: 4'-phosphopantetheinyl transferase superfamily protein, partial [Oscillospiraceae bacterium]|nr:4'-phosphopantetheinyl transferase superfamily protein [Oscillospiraceae bacterium]
ISLKKMFGIEEYSLRTGGCGKPYLVECTDVLFNLSHCTGLAVCGISESEIGVDCELIRAYSGNAAKRIFSDTEIGLVFESPDPDETFFRIWTLKEALGKAMGTGILSDLKRYEFVFENGRPVCKALPEKFFSQKIICGKWVVSVCSDVPENDFEEVSEKYCN